MNKNMKKGLFFLLGMFMGYMNMAQVPNSFSYQMVIRNGNNELVANTTVGIRIGLLGGAAADTVWYEEEHKVKTNLNGLAYITIGKGNILKGAISTIDWTRGPFFIKSETDPTGGTNYSLVIVSQMLSVPYAIYAKTAEKLSTPVTESDPLFNKSIASGITASDTAKWNRRETIYGNVGSGGGITNESDPIFNASVAKGIRSVDTAAWNNKLNLRDTLNMLRPYLRAADTASLSNRLNQKVDINQLNTNTLTLDGKVNIADTAGMLANYRTGINTKVNIADTARMLLPYLRGADTSSMLANYRTGIKEKVNIADTAVMLMPYLRKLDTASVSDRINLKVNIADTATMLMPYLRKLDTASVSDRINLKVNIADTAGMLTPYLRKLDTASVSDRINLKVNIADTSNMLANYRSALNVKAPINNPTFTGTVSGVDKNMVGLGSVDNTSDANKPVSTATQTALNGKENTISSGTTGQYYRGDKTFQTLDKSVVGLGNVDNTSDANKPVSTATQTALNLKVNIADTANMLTPYLRKLDTASLSNRINNAGLPTTGNSTGNLLYWNGSAWVRLSTGSFGQILKISAGGIPVWGNADFDCGLNRLKDIDGNIYNTVAIGSQCWTKENLKVTKYNDGTSIPLDATGGSGGTSITWEYINTGAYTIYGNQASSDLNATNYGFLYNYYAASDSRKLCPIGWHVPSDAEWTTLTDYLGGVIVAGGKLKKNDALWSTNTGTDNYGFSALPGGFRKFDGSFYSIRDFAVFWSATEDVGSNAWCRDLYGGNGNVGRYSSSKHYGFSVRCLKD
jgi:uncharacterized protein (TIGR02145 family)